MSALKIAYIGAGAVNFGGAEGPWNHSARLEKLGGVHFVAIVDPLVERAKSLLETKLKGPSASMYSECCVLPSYKDVLKMEARTKPDAVFVGERYCTCGHGTAAYIIYLMIRYGADRTDLNNHSC